ncbi:hypothetical protein BHQ23_07460 [Mycobacterium gordonae]|nr:hypothetical protein BHQ23_07460 [Mycobacterium gordonae]
MTFELMRDDDAGQKGPLRRSAVEVGRDDDAGQKGPLRRSAVEVGRDDDAGQKGPLRRSAHNSIGLVRHRIRCSRAILTQWTGAPPVCRLMVLWRLEGMHGCSSGNTNLPPGQWPSLFLTPTMPEGQTAGIARR